MFCREQVVQLRDRLDDIRDAGAELVIVGNGSAMFASAFREDFDLDCSLLIDPELRSYRAAGLRRGRAEILSPALIPAAARAYRSGARQSTVQGDPWQLGGVFVIRPDGSLAYRYISANAGDHASVDEIVEALRSDAASVDESGRTSLLDAWSAWAGRVASCVIDPTVALSFAQVGFNVHSLNFDPDDLDVDLTGKRVLITGANAGLGFEAALAIADLGATVELLCRNEVRGNEAARRIRERTGNDNVSACVVDVSNLDSVAEVAAELGRQPVDVLIHNAGILAAHRTETEQGDESAFATHVAGPFLLTRLLVPALEAADAGRVVWVSSGGMYTQRLSLRDYRWEEREYDGVVAYAATKRMQVVLSEMWADVLAHTSVTCNAMHPGWADTPGVRSSIPTFRRWTRYILRTPAQGADSIVWLAASRAARKFTGKFFFDREVRRTHFVPFTRETELDRKALWGLCEAKVAHWYAAPPDETAASSVQAVAECGDP